MLVLKNRLAVEMAELKKTHEFTMNEQRTVFETQINGLEDSLRQAQKTIVKLESTVLELNTILTSKRDVEKQRDTWKAHHDSMEASKRELQVQLEGASAYINQLEEKFYESQTTQLEMLK